MKNKLHYEQLLWNFLQDYDTFLTINFYYIWEYIFLNNSGAFKGFRIFYGNVRLNVWIQFSQIKEKSIFSTSEGGK